jgi:hypothetical protein
VGSAIREGIRVWLKVEPNRTYNIEFLLNQGSAIEADFRSIEPSNLTYYGVEARYPGDFLEPSAMELKGLIVIVDQSREIVLGKYREQPFFSLILPVECYKVTGLQYLW